MPRKEAVDLPQGPHLKVGTVPTSVNDAARRLRRWPTAIIDRGSARRWWDFDRDEETDRSQKKKLMRFDFDPAIRERMITSFIMRDRAKRGIPTREFAYWHLCERRPYPPEQHPAAWLCSFASCIGGHGTSP